MKWRLIIMLLLVLLCGQQLSAQYYNTGQTPYSIEWKNIERDSIRVIYPSGYDTNARRTLFYMDSMKESVNYGLTAPLMKIPVVFKTENFESNGIAMWAPRRIEMIAFPSIDSYSEPWLKQLATHEYRHIAQYSNMNRHAVKAVSYLFGQQASLVATGLMPFWFLEGDAVDAETQMSTFGRALQPSFTIGYRAAGRKVLEKKGHGMWFGGSYKAYAPNHYMLGYQMVSWANTHFGKYIWDDMIDFSSRRPYAIPTFNRALKKNYGLSVNDLFHKTFTDLNDYWDSLPQVDDSAEKLNVPITAYTTYSYPMFLNDSTIVAFKTDSDRPSRVVTVDVESGRERVIAHTGKVSSRPVLRDSVLYWTEYRESVFWEQRVNSQLCYMDLRDGREHAVRNERRTLFPSILADGTLAYVLYDYDGTYSLVAGNKTLSFGLDTSLHGLDYDEKTNALYFISLKDDGMAIESWSLTDGALRTVKRAAHVTLSDLRAADGELWFGSVASGKDEVHMLDLESGKEYRVSSSRYGSFDASPSADGKEVVLTAYDARGYIVAVQDVVLQEEVPYSEVPRNVVNPPRYKWDVANVDEVRFTENNLDESVDEESAKRYRKNFNLFNIHSWGPIDYDPDEVMDGDLSKLKFNVSAFSQNLLSSVVSHMNYGYSFDGYSNVGFDIKYMAFAPKFEFSVLWEDRKPAPSTIVRQSEDSTMNYYTYYDDGDVVLKPVDAPQEAPVRVRDYMQIRSRVYLPILLQNGYHTRSIVPSLEYKYQRIPLYRPDTESYASGTNWLYASLQYTDNVAKAKKDFLPRFGYALKATYGMDPFYSHTTSVLSLLGRVYLPGVALHHSVTLRANYQNLFGRAVYSYAVNDLVPRGFSKTPSPIDYLAGSVDYQLPLMYPDWGVNGLFFLKRIRLGTYYDYAQFASFGKPQPTDNIALFNLEKSTERIYSYGASLYFDTVFFNMPAQGETSLRVSLYVPSINNRPVVSVGVSLPL